MSPTAAVRHEPDGVLPPLDATVHDGASGRPAVNIVEVEARRIEAGPRAGWYRVAATVELGRLTPADVIVCLVPASRKAEDAARLMEHDRLWSAIAYNNGTYRFETDVPAPRLRAAERLKIHVGPAAGAPASFTRGTPGGCWHLVPEPATDDA